VLASPRCAAAWGDKQCALRIVMGIRRQWRFTGRSRCNMPLCNRETSFGALRPQLAMNQHLRCQALLALESDMRAQYCMQESSVNLMRTGCQHDVAPTLALAGWHVHHRLSNLHDSAERASRMGAARRYGTALSPTHAGWTI
jgi:hypothetical protein